MLRRDYVGYSLRPPSKTTHMDQAIFACEYPLSFDMPGYMHTVEQGADGQAVSLCQTLVSFC